MSKNDVAHYNFDADQLIFTVRLHLMQRTVLLSKFCPSVCLTVRRVYCEKITCLSSKVEYVLQAIHCALTLICPTEKFNG